MIFPVESQVAVRNAPILPLSTHFGPVRIAVTDRAKALAIWQDVVGLNILHEDEKSIDLGVDGKTLISLELGATRPVVQHTIGLSHVAIHVPTRADLAQMAVRGEVEFDFDSDYRDIAAGATPIAPTFIVDGKVVGTVFNASGVEVGSATGTCRVRR